MTTPLIEQQIYLLERYSSLEYFRMMRDAFNDLLKAGWAALDEFMLHLPRDYRSLPLYDQPDIVWGERVLRNFNRTADFVDVAYDRLEAGDFSALGAANGITNDFAGVGRDYSDDWMPEPFLSEYRAKWDLAMEFAPNIRNTGNQGWGFKSLLNFDWNDKEYWDIYWKILPPPPTWPIYRLNTDVQMKTGEKVPRSGIYLPEIDEACPQLQVGGDVASRAAVGRGANGFGCRSIEPTLWTLVERVADEGGAVPGEEPWRVNVLDLAPYRVEGGQPCPADGFWWTPASKQGKGHFKKDDVMPNFTDSKYGAMIWYREKE
jgi:hypothetical protein